MVPLKTLIIVAGLNLGSLFTALLGVGIRPVGALEGGRLALLFTGSSLLLLVRHVEAMVGVETDSMLVLDKADSVGAGAAKVASNSVKLGLLSGAWVLLQKCVRTVMTWGKSAFIKAIHVTNMANVKNVLGKEPVEKVLTPSFWQGFVYFGFASGILKDAAMDTVFTWETMTKKITAAIQSFMSKSGLKINAAVSTVSSHAMKDAQDLAKQVTQGGKSVTKGADDAVKKVSGSQHKHTDKLTGNSKLLKQKSSESVETHGKEVGAIAKAHAQQLLVTHAQLGDQLHASHQDIASGVDHHGNLLEDSINDAEKKFVKAIEKSGKIIEQATLKYASNHQETLHKSATEVSHQTHRHGQAVVAGASWISKVLLWVVIANFFLVMLFFLFYVLTWMRAQKRTKQKFQMDHEFELAEVEVDYKMLKFQEREFGHLRARPYWLSIKTDQERERLQTLDKWSKPMAQIETRNLKEWQKDFKRADEPTKHMMIAQPHGTRFQLMELENAPFQNECARALV